MTIWCLGRQFLYLRWFIWFCCWWNLFTECSKYYQPYSEPIMLHCVNIVETWKVVLVGTGNYVIQNGTTPRLYAIYYLVYTSYHLLRNLGPWHLVKISRWFTVVILQLISHTTRTILSLLRDWNTLAVETLCWIDFYCGMSDSILVTHSRAY